jgi:hypothetical protein
MLTSLPTIATLGIFPLAYLGLKGKNSPIPGIRHYIAIGLALLQAIWIVLMVSIALEVMLYIHPPCQNPNVIYTTSFGV